MLQRGILAKNRCPLFRIPRWVAMLYNTPMHKTIESESDRPKESNGCLPASRASPASSMQPDCRR
jgi:hypothetical protein